MKNGKNWVEWVSNNKKKKSKEGWLLSKARKTGFNAIQAIPRLFLSSTNGFLHSFCVSRYTRKRETTFRRSGTGSGIFFFIASCLLGVCDCEESYREWMRERKCYLSLNRLFMKYRRRRRCRILYFVRRVVWDAMKNWISQDTAFLSTLILSPSSSKGARF